MTNNLSILTELQPIAKRMREREEIIIKGKRDVQANVCEVLGHAVEQGQDITLVKSKLGKGATLDQWLAVHVPTLPVDTAAKYVRLSHERKEQDAGQWMFLFVEPQTKQLTETVTRVKPGEREVLWSRIVDLNKVIKASDVARWSEPDRELIRAELEPTAKLLWPERF